MNQSLHLLLPEASSMAPRIDALFLTLLGITATVAIAVAVVIVLFSFRYREGSRADRRNVPATARWLEVTWTVLPLLAFFAIFVWAAYEYSVLYRAPDGAMPVFVVAKQWMWKVQHTNGRREINELHVPVGRAVRLVMASEDAIHSFYAPAFRVKQDLVPGRYTSVWFTATRSGEYHLLCAEYCGADHSLMRGRIVALEPTEFTRWLARGAPEATLAARGFALFRRFGCSGCHDPRSSVHAPDLNGLMGRVVHLQDGRSLIADENYIRDSVLLPKKDVVAGFEPIMPSFEGQVSEEELVALIEYIRSTNPGAAGSPRTSAPPRQQPR